MKKVAAISRLFLQYQPLLSRHCCDSDGIAPDLQLRTVNKIQQGKFKDLVGFIQWFMNQAASHAANR